MRDVQPGEIIKLERNQPPKTLVIIPRPDNYDVPAFCIFEYVYFAKADSIVENQMIYSVRQNCGRQLAIEAPVKYANEEERSKLIVAPVPESSIPAALGFAEQVNNFYFLITFILLICDIFINLLVWFAVCGSFL